MNKPRGPPIHNLFPFSDWIEYVASIIAILSFAYKAIERIRRDAGLRRIVEALFVLGVIVGTGFLLATYGSFTVSHEGFKVATDSTGGAYPSTGSMTSDFGIMIALFLAIPGTFLGGLYGEKAIRWLEHSVRGFD